MRRQVPTALIALLLAACSSAVPATPSAGSSASPTANPAPAIESAAPATPTRTPRPAIGFEATLLAAATQRALDATNPPPTRTPLALPPPPTPYETVSAGWVTYRNEIYGFEFHYPPEWTLLEEQGPSENSEQKYGTFVRLGRDTTILSIGVKRSAETDVRIGCTGTAAGDPVEGGLVRFFDQEVRIIWLVFENRVMQVGFNRLCGQIVVEPLAFSLSMASDAPTLDTLYIDPTHVMEVVQILATFEIWD